MQIQRNVQRTMVDIPVTVTSVLDSFDAGIADLSEYGAQIVGCSVSPGMRIQIDFMGQVIFAQCRWSEVDRMGVKFLFLLTHGPLYERLAIARATQFDEGGSTGLHPAFTPMNHGQAPLAARTFSRVQPAGHFGRRH